MHTFGYLGEILNPVSNGSELCDPSIGLDIEELTRRSQHMLGAAMLYDVALGHIRETVESDNLERIHGATLSLDGFWDVYAFADAVASKLTSYILGEQIPLQIEVHPTEANPVEIGFEQEVITITPDSALHEGWDDKGLNKSLNHQLDEDELWRLAADLQIAIAAYSRANTKRR